eukprot:6471230-Amphidinium_carterae.1
MAPRSRQSGGNTSVVLPIPACPRSSSRTRSARASARTSDPEVPIRSTWGPVTAAGGWHAGGVGITA